MLRHAGLDRANDCRAGHGDLHHADANDDGASRGTATPNEQHQYEYSSAYFAEFIGNRVSANLSVDTDPMGEQSRGVGGA